MLPERIGHYEVLRELGSGHYGTVYLARGDVPTRQGAKRRTVAIKQLRDPADPEAQATLLQEFELLGQVHHRSMCKVYEFLDVEQAIVMEAVHGVTLRDVLDTVERTHTSVLTEAAVEIGCEVADCLYQAWATPGRNGEPLQIVHRDLKPENIMLTPKGEVKILDFGLARAHRGRIGEDDAKGTVLYMAPEQARGEGVDHRTDLFATGLILYELLMGEPAYEVTRTTDSGVNHLMDRIDRAELDTQIERLDTKLGKLGRVVGRCLRADRRLRYDDGHELLLDLRRHLSKEHGAYLREFCGYFFTALHPLEPLEPLDSKPRASTRRVDPMANDKKPPRPGAPPRPSRGGPPRPGAPRPGAPRPGGPAGRPPASRPPSAPKTAPPPAPSPPAPSSGRRLRPVGNVKSPDATGMLQMVPLDEADEPENSKKSATQFFSIPGAKRAPTPPSSSNMPGGGGRSMPQQASASIAPISGPTAGAGPSQFQPGVSYSGGASMPPIAMQGGGISGPVASGPAAQNASPFQVQGQDAPPPGDSENRSRSWRIYLILLLLFGMVFSVAVIVVLAVVLGLNAGKDDVAEPSAGPISVAPGPTPAPSGRDTAAPPPPLPAEPYRPPAQPRPRPSSGGSTTTTAPSSGPAPAPAPRPAPAAAGGTVTVMVPEGVRFTTVEIKCDASGFRQRGAFSGQTARVEGVPNESCTVYFKGGQAAQYRPVSGGNSYSCTFPAPGTASCR